MIDKKTLTDLDIIIKKIKDNDLSSIKISNKTNTIEITNSSKTLNNNNQTQLNLTEPKIDKLENTTTLISIDSPMVGIIYMTPKPSSPPFVKTGQKIKKGDTICLIEAMKTFNEIKSDKDCVIKSVLVKNGEAVEFGQPLFEIS